MNKTWTWLKRNWWVGPLLVFLVAAYIVTAGKSGSPFVRLNKVRRNLDKEYQDKVDKIDTEAEEKQRELDRELDKNLNKLEDEVANEINRLSDPDNADELVDILRKRYSRRDNDL